MTTVQPRQASLPQLQPSTDYHGKQGNFVPNAPRYTYVTMPGSVYNAESNTDVLDRGNIFAFDPTDLVGFSNPQSVEYQVIANEINDFGNNITPEARESLYEQSRSIQNMVNSMQTNGITPDSMMNLVNITQNVYNMVPPALMQGDLEGYQNTVGQIPNYGSDKQGFQDNPNAPPPNYDKPVEAISSSNNKFGINPDMWNKAEFLGGVMLLKKGWDQFKSARSMWTAAGGTFEGVAAAQGATIGSIAEGVQTSVGAYAAGAIGDAEVGAIGGVVAGDLTAGALQAGAALGLSEGAVVGGAALAGPVLVGAFLVAMAGYGMYRGLGGQSVLPDWGL